MSDPDSRPESRGDSVFSPLFRWVSFKGNRLSITGGLTVGIFLLTWGLVSVDVIAVGPRSSVKTMFGSGIIAGVFTLLTVTLSINQLISTRVFGAPNALDSKFEGGKQLRKTVEDIAGREASPVSTAAFISLIGDVLEERVQKFEARTARDGHPPAEELEAYISRVEQYAAQIRSVSASMHPITVISTTEGSDYARHIRDIERLQGTRSDQLSSEANEHLEAIIDLLRAFSISRQYYKTITIQQDFAQLTRLLIFVSLPAVLTAFYVPLLYQSGPDTVIAPEYLPLVISGAIAVISIPLLLLLMFLLRITTVMRYTVSVGPFSTPSEWPWDE